MAEARQKEMKVNITVVATKTLMAGLEPPTEVAMLQRNADCDRNKTLKIAQATRFERAPALSVLSFGLYRPRGNH